MSLAFIVHTITTTTTTTTATATATATATTTTTPTTATPTATTTHHVSPAINSRLLSVVHQPPSIPSFVLSPVMKSRRRPGVAHSKSTPAFKAETWGPVQSHSEGEKSHPNEKTPLKTQVFMVLMILSLISWHFIHPLFFGMRKISNSQKKAGRGVFNNPWNHQENTSALRYARTVAPFPTPP